MRKLIIAGFVYSNVAWAHEGHGALSVHMHWWEYGLIVAVFAGVAAYITKK